MPRPTLRTALLVALLALAGVGWLAWPRDAATGVLHARAVRAVDGDTIVVRLAGGELERVRLIGVDTPESVAPGRPVECYAHRASAFTARAIRGRDLELRPGAERRDRYGRLLAYVRVEGARQSLSVRLLEAGMARPLAIRPNVEHASEYRRLAQDARTARRGLWGACHG